jgi:hypothetical protein
MSMLMRGPQPYYLTCEDMRKGTIVASALLLSSTVGLALAPLTHLAQIKNTDFITFYAGASIVRRGNGVNLYQLETQAAAFRSVLGRESPEHFLHPAFEAVALAPLTFLSIEHAFLAWTMINIAVLALLPLVLTPCIPLVARKPYFGLLGFFFPPVLIALSLGQDSLLLLFVMSLSYLLMHKRMDVTAGLVLALAAIKFQYLIILIPLLLVSRKLRVGVGLGLGCAGLAGLSVLVTGWGGLWTYLRFVHIIDSQGGPGAPNPLLMVNFRGFLAGTGWAPESWAYPAAAAAVIFLGVAIGARTAPILQKNGLVVAVYVAVALVVSPSAHFPDMTLLLLPLLLAMDWLAETGIESIRAAAIAFACVSLFLWPVFLIARGGYYWWNSQIYLVFPCIVFFIGTLTAELRFGKEQAPS